MWTTAGEDGAGAQGHGDVVGCWKHVEVADSSFDGSLEHEAWPAAFEWKPMDHGVHMVFDGTHGTFSLGHMVVSIDNVALDGVEEVEVATEASKFLVSLNVDHIKTLRFI